MNLSARAAALFTSLALFAWYGSLIWSLHAQVSLEGMAFEVGVLCVGVAVWIVSLFLPASVPRFVTVIGEVPILSGGIFALLCILIFQSTLKDVAGLLPGYTVSEIVAFASASMLIMLDLALAVAAAKERQLHHTEQPNSPAAAG